MSCTVTSRAGARAGPRIGTPIPLVNNRILFAFYKTKYPPVSGLCFSGRIDVIYLSFQLRRARFRLISTNPFPLFLSFSLKINKIFSLFLSFALFYTFYNRFLGWNETVR